MTLRNLISSRAGLRFLAAIGALAGAGVARAQAPHVHRTDVFVAGQDGITEYRIPVLLTSTKGTLLAFCDARVKKPGDPPNYIKLVMKRSTDGGATWGTLRTLVDPGEGQGAVADSCGLVDRQTGIIWVFSDYCPEGVGGGNARPGLTGATVSYKAIKSDDDGLTWSVPIDFTPMVKKPGWCAGSFGPGKGIQMRSGRLVFPRYYTDTSGRAEPSAEPPAVSFVVFSDDHGKTWQIGGETETHGNTNECQVVEAADGSLVLNMRGITGTHRKIARSTDGGQTWGQVVEDRALIEPRCQGSVEYLVGTDGHQGHLLFSNPASTRRENLTIRLSDDDGRTWPVARQVYAGPAAYSCLSALPDGTAGCLYECGKANPHEKISFVKFNVAWLTQGRASGSK